MLLGDNMSKRKRRTTTEPDFEIRQMPTFGSGMYTDDQDEMQRRATIYRIIGYLGDYLDNKHLNEFEKGMLMEVLAYFTLVSNSREEDISFFEV